jgi:hypothetical protein
MPAVRNSPAGGMPAVHNSPSGGMPAVRNSPADGMPVVSFKEKPALPKPSSNAAESTMPISPFDEEDLDEWDTQLPFDDIEAKRRAAAGVRAQSMTQELEEDMVLDEADVADSRPVVALEADADEAVEVDFAEEERLAAMSPAQRAAYAEEKARAAITPMPEMRPPATTPSRALASAKAKPTFTQTGDWMGALEIEDEGGDGEIVVVESEKRERGLSVIDDGEGGESGDDWLGSLAIDDED